MDLLNSSKLKKAVHLDFLALAIHYEISMEKTNVMRILDSKNLPYTALSYQWDESHLDAQSAAEQLQVPPECVFKTIVMQDAANTVFVFCVPATAEVSMKKAKNLVGRKVNPLKLTALQSVTGYMRGGCSPIGMKKAFPVYIDETALLYDCIYLSAGKRGMQIGIHPENLQKACDAVFADIAEPMG